MSQGPDDAMTVVGMISGTSMDGIDVAAARFSLSNDRVDLRPLAARSVPYPDQLREDLIAALPPAGTTAETICRLDNEVGRVFASVAEQFIADLGVDAELVVSHGQTLFHLVEGGRVEGTLQIGQPAWIAEATGLPVVADLRVADVAAGGQGAPLASLFDALLLGDSQVPRASLNIGGIANLTVVGADEGPIAYDTGPGNALIDAAVARATRGAESYDRDGAMARTGSVSESLLELLLADPYYGKPPPKTTGKELFNVAYLERALAETPAVSDEDLVATVTALTAITIADACRAHGVSEVIAAGGGVENPALMEELADRMPGLALTSLAEWGLPAAAKESYFMALIGFLTVHGLPGNVPSATGASRPVVLGCLLPGKGGFVLPARRSESPTRLRIVTDETG